MARERTMRNKGQNVTAEKKLVVRRQAFLIFLNFLLDVMLDLFASINLLARRKRRLTNRSCSKTFLVVFNFVNRRPIHPTYRLYLYHHPTVRSLVRNSYLIYFRPLTNYFFSFVNQFFNLFVTRNINGSNLVKHSRLHRHEHCSVHWHLLLCDHFRLNLLSFSSFEPFSTLVTAAAAKLRKP